MHPSQDSQQQSPLLRTMDWYIDDVHKIRSSKILPQQKLDWSKKKNQK